MSSYNVTVGDHFGVTDTRDHATFEEALATYRAWVTYWPAFCHITNTQLCTDESDGLTTEELEQIVRL